MKHTADANVNSPGQVPCRAISGCNLLHLDPQTTCRASQVQGTPPSLGMLQIGKG